MTMFNTGALPTPTAQRWISGACSDTGPVRSVNEDAVLQLDERRLWAVADGLGGHHIGDVASKILVQRLSEVVVKPALDEMVEALEDRLIAINDDIQHYARKHIDGKKMGCTAVVLHILGCVGVCLWVGDSRLYRLRGNTLKQMTRDHSHVEELIRRGMLARSEAATHPERNVITRAIGADPEVQVELAVFGVDARDSFLLCSDGLYDVVDAQQLARTLLQTQPSVCAQRLIQQALSNQANDNISAVVVKPGH